MSRFKLKKVVKHLPYLLGTPFVIFGLYLIIAWVWINFRPPMIQAYHIVVLSLYILTHAIVLWRSPSLRWKVMNYKPQYIALFLVTGAFAIWAMNRFVYGIITEPDPERIVETRAIIRDISYSKSGTTSRCHARVEYTVKTITYTYGELFLCNPTKHKQGGRITLYYDSNNPNKAAIDPIYQRLQYMSGCCLGLIMWFGVYWLGWALEGRGAW